MHDLNDDIWCSTNYVYQQLQGDGSTVQLSRPSGAAGMACPFIFHHSKNHVPPSHPATVRWGRRVTVLIEGSYSCDVPATEHAKDTNLRYITYLLYWSTSTYVLLWYGCFPSEVLLNWWLMEPPNLLTHQPQHTFSSTFHLWSADTQCKVRGLFCRR